MSRGFKAFMRAIKDPENGQRFDPKVLESARAAAEASIKRPPRGDRDPRGPRQNKPSVPIKVTVSDRAKERALPVGISPTGDYRGPDNDGRK